MLTNPDKLSSVRVFLLYLLTALFAFGLILTKSISSDDFEVVYRVAYQHSFLLTGFFRPLSDFTFFLNYLIGGTSDMVYIIFNLLIHLGCSFLLYLFCKKSTVLFRIEAPFFPFLAGMLFLLYPFHNEAIAWGVGRGASLSVLFALLAMCTIISSTSFWIRVAGVNAFLFTGLLAYESIITLPLILLLLAWKKEASRKQLLYFAGSLILTLAAHFMIRTFYAGSVTGGYAANMFNLSAARYAEHFLEAAARLVTPPLKNSTYFIISSALMGSLFLVALYRIFTKANSTIRQLLVMLLLWLAAAMCIAVLFPVSTKTSESDRLLYFPSVFICMLVGLMIIKIQESAKGRLIITGFVLLYFTSFLQLNNLNWRKASGITREILAVCERQNKIGYKTYFLNLPNEEAGAYIFRHGFREAVHIHRLDTARLKAVNVLTKEEQQSAPALIEPVISAGRISLYPGIEISDQAVGNRLIQFNGTGLYIDKGDQVWYWNNQQFVQLKFIADEKDR